MARHAGFGAVATITEETINAVIDSYMQSVLPPTLYFPLPETINVGFAQVNLAGLMRIGLRPLSFTPTQIT